MIFEILFTTSYTLLYPYIPHAIQTYLNTPSTKTFFDSPKFEISNPWDSLTEEEYIEDILKNYCEETDCSDYKRRPFHIFGHKPSVFIGHCYQARGNN